MRKKILLIEKSDSIRGMAEPLLRQNGYEVISLNDVEKGLEVMKFARPDLLIAGGDLTTDNGKALFAKVKEDHSLKSVPILLLVDEGGQDQSLPAEMLLTRPLDPDELLEKANLFTGAKVVTADSSPQPNPLGDATLDDDFLDAALGLDGLGEMESEDMDKTVHGKRKRSKQSVEKLVGLGHFDADTNDPSDSRRVESVMIEEDSTDIVQKVQSKKAPTPPSGTGKLDILSDQYGISDPSAVEPSGADRAHDYDWFINEMQVDAQASESPPKDFGSDTGSLSITPNSSVVDPITPAPASVGLEQPAQKSGGVEKFIDEFKKEIEKIDTEQPDKVIVKETGTTTGDRKTGRLAWEDSIENVSPEQVALFTRQLAYDLAEKIARMIVDKIDNDKLLDLVKTEIIAHANRQKNQS